MKNRQNRNTLFSIFALFILLSLSPILRSEEVKAPPQVVVSITPFYNLVAFIMQGVGTPTLLVKPGASPHEYSLKPSEVKKLINADILFWGDENLETFLVKPLDSLKSTESAPKHIVMLSQTPKLLLLPTRQSPGWEPHEHAHDHDGEESDHDHEHDHDHNHSHDAHGINDMHFWLDPNNAILLSDAIAKSLSAIDPLHASIYQKNVENLKQHIKKTDEKIAAQLKSMQGKPFVVFHDAYQYFEKHYGLNGVGSITLHPELPPSIQRLNTIRETIQETHAVCVFSEPQFEPKIVQTITEDLKVKTGELDPLGNPAKPNADGYSELLENLSNSLVKCLK